MAILKQSQVKWPTREEWAEFLPSWFVETFAPEKTPEEKAAWLAHWKSLTYEEKLRQAPESQWTLSNWLYWFRPGQRQWWWWDAKAESSNTLKVEVEAEGWPFSSGTLDWLFKTAGGESIERIP